MLVTALGELLIDFTPAGVSAEGLPLFTCNPGGAPANMLAAVQKLGGDTAFIGMVGQDGFGDFLKQYLAGLGIHISGLIQTVEANTTLAFVQLDSNGDRSFSFYRNPGADQLITRQDVNIQLIDDSDVFHFGSLSLTGEAARDATLYAVSHAKGRGKIISYDPNYRPLLWENEETACYWMKEGAKLADIIKISEEELPLLTERHDSREAAEVLMESGCSLVLVSMGAKGAGFYTRTASGFVPTYEVKTVDTTGAGDSFLGACLYRIRGKSLKEIQDMSAVELADIVRYANAAGSITTTRSGAICAMPTEQEIEKCMQMPVLVLT